MAQDQGIRYQIFEDNESEISFKPIQNVSTPTNNLVVPTFKIPDNIHQEKVVPKNDLICAISQTEFKNNEMRIISGCCFSSFKKKTIEMWFYSKNKKICPYCREEDSVWWYY